MVLKYVSALLAVWYCMSIIGFDVHSCNTTGNVFVNSMLSGTTCDDVHPEHDCSGHKSCCASHSCACSSSCCHSVPVTDGENVSSEDDDCCTNQIEVLESEGVAVSGDKTCCQLAATLAYLYFDNTDNLPHVLNVACRVYSPDLGSVCRPDQQAVLSIWRI